MKRPVARRVIGAPVRAMISGGLAAAVLSAVPVLAQTAPPALSERFSSVTVDVRPLLARGLGPYADVVKGDLEGALRRAFADRLGGAGPALVVRVTGLSMNMYAGPEGGRRSGFGGGVMQSDYLEGEALVVGRGGQILARRPQLSATPASSGGAWYDPASERRRTAYLADHYAQWLRRGLD